MAAKVSFWYWLKGKYFSLSEVIIRMILCLPVFLGCLPAPFNLKMFQFISHVYSFTQRYNKDTQCLILARHGIIKDNKWSITYYKQV